ncbi:hypothetical protein EJB05_24151, partial [Eragrostis curvula]
MSERRRRKASRMAASEARAADLIARRSTGSTEGSVVEVARSMRDAMEDSTAAEEDEGFEPSSASAERGGARRPANEVEAVGRGMAAIRGERRKPAVRWRVRLVGREEEDGMVGPGFTTLPRGPEPDQVASPSTIDADAIPNLKAYLKAQRD